jgi:hypothetical protein
MTRNGDEAGRLLSSLARSCLQQIVSFAGLPFARFERLRFPFHLILFIVSKTHHQVPNGLPSQLSSPLLHYAGIRRPPSPQNAPKAPGRPRTAALHGEARGARAGEQPDATAHPLPVCPLHVEAEVALWGIWRGCCRAAAAAPPSHSSPPL